MWDGPRLQAGLSGSFARGLSSSCVPGMSTLISYSLRHLAGEEVEAPGLNNPH